MAFRFRRSLRLVPGVRLNLSKSGASVSFGGRGFHYTIGPKGTRTTVGLPGTGLSWTEYTRHQKRSTGMADAAQETRSPGSEIASDDLLVPIERASAEQIGALSTSDLAPILNGINKRLRISPIVVGGLALSALAAGSAGDEQAAGALVLGCILLGILAVRIDGYRRSVGIEYEPTGIAAEVAAAQARSFAPITEAASVWTVQAAGNTADWKRHAGATQLNARKRIQPRLGRPSCIRGSLSVPCISFGRQALYFLPDAALFIDGKAVAALDYRDVVVSDQSIRFVEEEAVPSDATVVGETWRFVNKNGGPDRRFNNNKRLPICLYGELNFLSDSGLNGRVHLSNPKSAETFVRVMSAIASHSNESSFKPVKSYREPKRWPTVLVVCASLLFVIATSVLSNIGFTPNPATSSGGGPKPSGGQVVPPAALPTRAPLSGPALDTSPLHDPLIIVPSSDKGLPPVPSPRPR